MSDRRTSSPHGDLEDTSPTSQGVGQRNALSGLDQIRGAVPTAGGSSPATAPLSGLGIADALARVEAWRQWREQDAQRREGLPTAVTDSLATARPPLLRGADVLAKITAKKAERAQAAAAAEALKRNRSSDNGDGAEETSRRMSEEKETKNEPPTKKVGSLPQVECFRQSRCFLRVNDSPVVGSILDQNGWKVFMGLDGRPDDPSITLTFRCNGSKKRMSQPVAHADGPIDTDEVLLTFRPGGRSYYYPDHKRLEQYQSFDLPTCDDPTILLPEITQGLTPLQLQNAMAFKFQCWHAGYNEKPDLAKWAKYSQSGITEVFRQFWLGYPFDVTIWISPHHLDDGQKLGRERFKMACEEHVEDESKS